MCYYLNVHFQGQWVNSYAAYCKLSSVLDITTWLSAKKKKKNFEHLLVFWKWNEFLLCFFFCHLVIISSKYIVRSVEDRGQPCRTPLLISANLDGLELKFY